MDKSGQADGLRRRAGGDFHWGNRTNALSGTPPRSGRAVVSRVGAYRVTSRPSTCGVSLPETHNPRAIMRKPSDKFRKTPDFLKTLKVSKNRESRRNCGNRERSLIMEQETCIR